MPALKACYTILMEQSVIGIGGSHSGAGKTTVACQLIRALKAEGMSVGALKCEPDSLYTSVTDEPSHINEPGKDTALMRQAGADEVLRVQAPRGDMHEALGMAIDRLSAHGCVIVEGNSAIEVLRPRIVLFITGLQGTATPKKESARRVLALSHVLIHDGHVPPEAPGDVKKYSREEAGAYIAHVLSLIKGARYAR